MLLSIIFLTLSEEQQHQVEQIYEQYGELMLRTAKYFLSDQSLAEEMLQQSFVKIIKLAEENNFDFCNKTASFYVSIVRNLCRDYRRKQKKENAISIDAMAYEGLELSEMQNEDFNPEKIFIGHEMREEVMGFIDELKPIYKEALLLRLVHGISIREVAQLLGEKEETINSRYHRGRNMLIEKIQRG